MSKIVYTLIGLLVFWVLLAMLVVGIIEIVLGSWVLGGLLILGMVLGLTWVIKKWWR